MQKSDQLPSSIDAAVTRSRGRPRAFDRVTALAAATRLFWIKGFDATSIADLTAVMGIGSTSLYAAFDSKESLYAEALRHYGENYETLVWAGFFGAKTARDAIAALLKDSAAALTGSKADIPLGCMVTLSSAGGGDSPELGKRVRAARTILFTRLKSRLDQAVRDGEIPASVDTHGLARLVQSMQNGMSILARDGATCAELEAAARLAMQGWNSYIGT